MYVPYRQNLTDYPGFAFFWIHAVQDFVVRTSGDPASLAPAVRQVFADVDATVAVDGMMAMRESLSSAAAGQEFWMRLLGIFAGLGVFLAAIGIYGVVSYSVEQRTREFGIRVTLGAGKADILRLVLREGAVLTFIGLVLGIAGAFAATRQLESQLFGISRMDPMTIAAVAVVLVVVALLACYLPGRRAAGLNPVAALRVE
jgi:ABC-type antimicrobial peptide transport system permease subunit